MLRWLRNPTESTIFKVCAFVALAALLGCEQIEKIKENRATVARSDELLKIQRDCNARTAELRRSLELETWGRGQDYALQREAREVHLWRSLGKSAVDKDGRQLGNYCVLNAEPLQPRQCDAQQRKIGRILLEMEEVDRRFMQASDELLAHIGKAAEKARQQGKEKETPEP